MKPVHSRVSILCGLTLLALLATCSGGGGGGGAAPVKPPPKPKPVALVFEIEPKSVLAESRFSVRVSVRDAGGKVFATTETLVSMAVSKGRLDGQLSKSTTKGIAVFDDLRIDRHDSSLQLVASAQNLASARSKAFDVERLPLHVFLFVADGWGYKQLEAARSYRKQSGVYDQWQQYAMATWDQDTRRLLGGKGYDPKKAWARFDYVNNSLAATDSASSATAMMCGQKTRRASISVNERHKARLESLREIGVRHGLGSGAVTSVPISHATPAAWLAHNNSRNNRFAIADEMLFGHPNTTGLAELDERWAGHWGPTEICDVLLGGGHPDWHSEHVTAKMLAKLRAESGKPGRFHLVERRKGVSGSKSLLAAAANASIDRLCGLFGGEFGNFEYGNADRKGYDPENPKLIDMTRAAIQVLERKPHGFTLMIENGAVDWAAHANLMDQMLGEQFDMDDAVQAAVDWIEDPSNRSNWSNSLVIVTGDHECGYLTAAPKVFADKPLGEVSARTLQLERAIGANGNRASWDDRNKNGNIDKGETVYWAWNSWGHSLSLIPCFAKGRNADEFARLVVDNDPVRGKYVDNTAVFRVMSEAIRPR